MRCGLNDGMGGKVCHYMDPNADDAIELHELEDTFVRAMQTPEADSLEKDVMRR